MGTHESYLMIKNISETYKVKKVSEPRQSSQGDMMGEKWNLIFKKRAVPAKVWAEFDKAKGNSSAGSDELMILLRGMGLKPQKEVSKWTSGKYAPYVFNVDKVGRCRIDPDGDWDVRSDNEENYIRLEKY